MSDLMATAPIRMGKEPSTRQESGRVAVAASASALHHTILPGTALVLTNIVMYSGTVSMSLRSTAPARLFFIALAMFAGVAVSGAVFPRIMALGGKARRAALLVLLGLAAVTVLPGFRQYVTNEPLRFAATFSFSLPFMPTYYLFFSRFPKAWRGRCIGLSWGLGVVCLSILSYMAHSMPRSAEDAYHPLQPTIYLVHAGAIVLLSGLCIWALVIKGDKPASAGATEAHIVPVPGMDAKKLVFFLFAIPAVLFFLNGILRARMTPALFSPPSAPLSLGFYAIVAVATPLAGWLMDRNPRNFPRVILPICCGVFLFAPPLATMSTAHTLHALLQPLTSAANHVVFALCTLAVTGLADNSLRAASRANGMYLLIFINPVVLIVWGRLLRVGTGVTMVTAAVAVCVMIAQGRRLRLMAVSPKPAAPESNARPTSGGSDGSERTASIASFLASAELTPRENEVAALLLRGKTILDMAFALGITESTVKKHLSNVFRKTGVANAQAFFARCHEIAGGAVAVEETESDD